MSSNTYNGWTNYATWRINLEILGDLDLAEFFDSKPDLADAATWCREYVEELIGDGNDLATSYALAFISDVNWREIATHLLTDSTFPIPDGDEE